jgi:hypothetical protein
MRNAILADIAEWAEQGREADECSPEEALASLDPETIAVEFIHNHDFVIKDDVHDPLLHAVWDVVEEFLSGEEK